MATLGAISVTLSARVSKFEDGLKRAQTALNKTSAAFNRFSTQSAKIPQGFSLAGRQMQKAADKFGAALKNAAQAASDSSAKFEKSFRATTQFAKGMEKAKKKTKSLETQLRTTLTALEQTSTTMRGIAKITIGFSLAFAAVGVASVAMAARFEGAMTRAAAVAGKTRKGFQGAFASMSKAALELAATTEFTAQQVAKGMQLVAMAGNDAVTTIGALPAVLQLASAAQLDLGRSADIVTNIMAGFGKQIGELAEVNNILVAAFTSANLNLSQLGEGFKTVGPVAKTLGISIEEVTATLGVLANAGIKGSEAGTGLKRAFTAFVKDASPKAVKAMKDLGLQASDLTKKGIVPVIKTLERMRAVLGAQVFTGKLFQLFGERAGPKLAALVQQGSGAIEKLLADIERGKRENIAEFLQTKVLETWTGQWKILISNVERGIITFGQGLFPILKPIVTSFQDWAKSLANISTETKSAAAESAAWIAILPALLAIATTVGLVILGVSKIVVGLKLAFAALIPVMTKVGAAIVATNPALAAFVVLAGVAALLIGLNIAENEEFLQQQDKIRDKLDISGKANKDLADNIGIVNKQLIDAKKHLKDVKTTQARKEQELFVQSLQSTLEQLRSLRQEEIGKTFAFPQIFGGREEIEKATFAELKAQALAVATIRKSLNEELAANRKRLDDEAQKRAIKNIEDLAALRKRLAARAKFARIELQAARGLQAAEQPEFAVLFSAINRFEDTIKSLTDAAKDGIISEQRQIAVKAQLRSTILEQAKAFVTSRKTTKEQSKAAVFAAELLNAFGIKVRRASSLITDLAEEVKKSRRRFAGIEVEAVRGLEAAEQPEFASLFSAVSQFKDTLTSLTKAVEDGFISEEREIAARKNLDLALIENFKTIVTGNKTAEGQARAAEVAARLLDGLGDAAQTAASLITKQSEESRKARKTFADIEITTTRQIAKAEEPELAPLFGIFDSFKDKFSEANKLIKEGNIPRARAIRLTQQLNDLLTLQTKEFVASKDTTEKQAEAALAAAEGLEAFGIEIKNVSSLVSDLANNFKKLIADVGPSLSEALSKGVFQAISGTNIPGGLGLSPEVTKGLAESLGGSLAGAISGQGVSIGSMVGAGVGAAIGAAGGPIGVAAGAAIGQIIETAGLGLVDALVSTIDSIVGDPRLSAAFDSTIFKLAAFNLALSLLTVAMGGPGAIPGAIAAGPIAINAFLLSLATSTDSFARFQDSFKGATNKIVEALEPLFDSLLPLAGLFDIAVDSLVVFANALAGGSSITLLFEAFRLGLVIFTGLMFVMGLFQNFILDMLSALTTGISLLLKGLAVVLRKFGLVGFAGSIDVAAAAMQNQADAMQSNKVNMEELGQAFIDAKSITEAAARARAENNIGLDENTDKLRETNQQLTNIPEGFKVVAARFKAATAEGEATAKELFRPPTAPTVFERPVVGASAGGVPTEAQVASPINIDIAQLTVEVEEDESFLDRFFTELQQRQFISTGSPLSNAMQFARGGT